MDSDKIREALVQLLTDIAHKAREDALRGESDIASVFKYEGQPLISLNIESIENAINDIKKATATKEGTKRLMTGILLVAKTTARIVL